MKHKANADERKKLKTVDDENFDERGKFKEGNVIGRMPKTGYNLNHLNKLILQFEQSKENKKGSLLKHYVKRLFKNDKLLAKYMDKNIATKNQLTGLNDGPISVTLNELIYKENSKDPETPAK